jgi:hypothetical protein
VKRARRVLLEELESLGFAAGGASFIAGVAMVSVPAAFMVGGALVCGATAMIAIGRRAQKRRRET